jgi:hypothetical protein
MLSVADTLMKLVRLIKRKCYVVLLGLTVLMHMPSLFSISFYSF